MTLRSVAENRSRDVGIFPLKNIIAAVTVESLEGKTWNVPSYNKLKQKFSEIVSIDSESLLNSL